jgi:hypothetical protein
MGQPKGWAPGPWDQSEDLYSEDDKMCRLPSARPLYFESTAASTSEAAADAAGRRAVDTILDAVDRYPELKGAGVVLQLPVGEALCLREPDHASGLDTYVHAQVMIASPVDQRTWWERWNGVVLNCGGAVISWVGVGASALAEVPTAGTSTVLLVVSYTSAGATTAQCGLAIAKETSDDFKEYVEGPNGEWVNYADIILDVISLAGGVAGGIAAVKDGGALLKTSRYASALEKLPKGQLLKQLEKLEKLEKDMGYFRTALDKLIKAKKVADPAARRVSSNLLKRALPFITSSLKKEMAANLSNVIGSAMSTVSSYYGGAGSKGWGLVRIIVRIYQESVLGETPP